MRSARVPFADRNFRAIVNVERVLSGELACGVEVLGVNHVGAAGAVGERAGLLQEPAIAERLEELVMRGCDGRVELRLADREHEIFHRVPVNACTDGAKYREWRISFPILHQIG
jgi:hypothetical protein